MEAARGPAAGSPRAPPLALSLRGSEAAEGTAAAAGRFADLDSELLSKADRIESELRGMAVKPKKALLAAKTVRTVTESQHQRAARFFAKNGLTKVMRLLGENASVAPAPNATIKQANATAANATAANATKASAPKAEAPKVPAAVKAAPNSRRAKIEAVGALMKGAGGAAAKAAPAAPKAVAKAAERKVEVQAVKLAKEPPAAPAKKAAPAAVDSGRVDEHLKDMSVARSRIYHKA
eukprot:SRR837773.20933.p2 GENE.SRR837773.20933~~SRR837773.20933.p2  ORF type:complete len:273 (-),score=102.60 SRR837773.20933:4-714(-)